MSELQRLLGDRSPASCIHGGESPSPSTAFNLIASSERNTTTLDDSYRPTTTISPPPRTTSIWWWRVQLFSSTINCLKSSETFQLEQQRVSDCLDDWHTNSGPVLTKNINFNKQMGIRDVKMGFFGRPEMSNFESTTVTDRDLCCRVEVWICHR